MSKRRIDKLERSLSPKEAVLHWFPEAHAFGTLSAYTESLTDQPDSLQPFVAPPAQVEQAVWQSTRRERPGFIKEVLREAVADTIVLLRLVIGINVHLEETLRIEGLRHAALYWWSRALDGAPADDDRWSDWRHGVSTLRGELLGTEMARAAMEARYLDGHDCLFPELAGEWRGLCAAAQAIADPKAEASGESSREIAEQRLRRVVLMARADGLGASGQWADADAVAARVLPAGTSPGGDRG